VHEYRSMEEARTSIGKWIAEYNHDRPHQSLKNRTPHEAFLAWQAIGAAIGRRATVLRLRACVELEGGPVERVLKDGVGVRGMEEGQLGIAKWVAGSLP
jgi:hypothetical protein